MIRIKVQTKTIDRFHVVALFFMTVFFFGPAQIFLSNLDGFPLPTAAVIRFLAGMTLMGIVLGMLLLSVIPEAFAGRVLSLLLATAFLLWLQGSILVWNYGPMNGLDIEWGKKMYLGLIDTPLWIFLLILAYIHSPIVKKIARPLSLALIAVQLITILFWVVPNIKNNSWKRYSINHRHEFSFSGSRNIIIVVLDCFQTDVFQELLIENQDYEKVFSGFTYFRNSLGGSPTTITAIPMILTGQQYDNSLPMAGFLKNNYTGNSLPLLLKKNNYRCDIYPLGGIGVGMYLNKNLASNLNDRFQVSFRDVAFLFDLTLFRELPHFLKIAIYNRQSWFFSQIFEKSALDLSRSRKAKKSKIAKLPDRSFVESMTEKAHVDSRQPVFKFYHLQGLHPPLQMNDKCQWKRMQFNHGNYKLQAKGLLRLVAAFLCKLRQIGSFRNTLILIIGDHGPGNMGLCDINLKALGIPLPETPPTKALQIVKAGALPLMLMKAADDPGENPLVISDAPVSLGDIPVTVATAMGLKNEFPGRPLFSLASTEGRLRRYLYYQGFNLNKQGFMKSISEYWVRGFSWFDTAWQESPNIFLPSGKKRYIRR